MLLLTKTAELAVEFDADCTVVVDVVVNVVTTSATWLITGGGGVGAKLTMGIRNFNLRSSQVRKSGKVRLDQSLTL